MMNAEEAASILGIMTKVEYDTAKRLEIETFFTFKEVKQMLMFGWTEKQIIQLYEAGIEYEHISYIQNNYIRTQNGLALEVFNLGVWAKTEIRRKYTRRRYAKIEEES